MWTNPYTKVRNSSSIGIHKNQIVVGGSLNFNKTVLMTSFDGTNGSTVVTDLSNSGHGVATVVGTAAISTAQSKFGGASATFDGSGASFTYSNHSDYRLSTANSDQFTIECFIRPHTAANQTIASFGSFGANRYVWELTFTGARQLNFFHSSNGSTLQSLGAGGTVMTLDGNFYHVCVDKDATGKIRSYIDGVLASSSTPVDSSMFNSTLDPLIIGSGVTGNFNGFIDELRITKGVAWYATDSGFTPPTTNFPRS